MNRRLLTAPLLGPLRGCVLWHDYRRLTALDYAPDGDQHPATLYGGAALDGALGLVLDGATGYAQTPYTAALACAHLTVYGWVLGANQTGKRVAHRYGAAAGTRSWQLQTLTSGGTGRLRVQLLGDGTTIAKDAYTTAAVFDGAPHHFACTWDGANLALYRDGAPASFTWQTNAAMTDLWTGGSEPVQIGSIFGTSFFAGSIRSLLVFNRALSAAEIAYLYEIGV